MMQRPSNVQRLQTRQETLWDAYVAAMEKAQQTLDINDGMAAGRAWKAFVDEFLIPEQREY